MEGGDEEGLPFIPRGRGIDGAAPHKGVVAEEGVGEGDLREVHDDGGSGKVEIHSIKPQLGVGTAIIGGWLGGLDTGAAVDVGGELSEAFTLVSTRVWM